MSLNKSKAKRGMKPHSGSFTKGGDVRRARKGTTPRPLTLGEIKAIEQYILHGNKMRAYKEAGYVSETSGAAIKFFRRPKIKQEVERRLANAMQKAELTEEWIIERLMKLADANILAILEKLEKNEYDISCLTFDEKYAVAELSQEVYLEKGSGDMVKKFKIKPESRQGALQQLARIKGMFNDKLALSGAEDLVARLQQGREQARLKDG